MDAEVHKLKERLNKQHEQQCLLEQIVSNISALVEGSGDPMCIFDKDGFFMHVNAACRRVLGINDQHSSPQLNIFDFYTSWDRERVFKESVQRRTAKWSGHVSFIKGGVSSSSTPPSISSSSSSSSTSSTSTPASSSSSYHHAQETRAFQSIEMLQSSGKNTMDGTFFKSYITVQENASQEKLQVYYEMIRHMPVGVALWRLEKNSCRLLCSNSLASQYVGVPLDLRKDIHETLPNGAEVHHFLEEVIKTQRVCTLEKFRGTPTGREVSVTAFPLAHECVAVVLDPPKKDGLMSSIESVGLGIAIIEGLRVSQYNEHFALLLGNQKDITGKDAITLLEQHARVTSRPQLFDMRRAIMESRVHNAEVEMEQHQWRICVHPFSDTLKRCAITAYRINLKTPPPVHRGTFPILPHLREALPLPPSQPVPTPAQSQPSMPNAQTPPSSTSSAPTSNTGLDNTFRELVDNFPCGVVVVKADRTHDIVRFRMVDVNRAARVFSDHLVVGKCFDESSPAPFDAAFVRVLSISAQTHERRMVSRMNLYGSYLVLAARTIPLRDQYIGIAFEEASVLTSPNPGKRSHSELDGVHLVLPNRKHKQEDTSISQTTPCITSQTSNPQNTLPAPAGPLILKQERLLTDEIRPPAAQECPSFTSRHSLDMGFPFNSSLPKPVLPPFHTPPPSSIAGILSPSGSNREKGENPIIQQCVIGIAYCDVNGELTVANRALSQMLGYAEFELVDSSIFTYVPDDTEIVRSTIRQLVNGESTSADVPLCFHHKRSHPIWTLTTFSMNKVVGERASVLLQVQQTSRMGRFPEVLLADREVLRAAFSELALCSVVMEVTGAGLLRICSANGAFCGLVGSKEEELRGHPLTDILHPDDREKTIKVAHEILTGRVPNKQISVRIHTRSGPMWAFLSLSVVHDSKSQPLVFVAQLQPMDKMSC